MSILDGGMFQNYSLNIGFGGTTTSVFTVPIFFTGLQRRDGRFTVLEIDGFQATLNTPGVINFTGNMTNPRNPIVFQVWVINNGITVPGTLQLNGDGTGSISVGYLGNFTAGTVGIQPTAVCYCHYLQPS
jgi:hypothetical protein